MCSTCYALRQKQMQGGATAALRDPDGRLVQNASKAMHLYTLPVRVFGTWFHYSSFGLSGGTIRFEERNRHQCEVALRHSYGFEGSVWFLAFPIDGGASGARSNGRFETDLLSKIGRQLASRADDVQQRSGQIP